MRIREVRPEEREEIALIYNNAYRVTLDVARSWVEHTDLRNTRAIFEGKRLVSILQIIPYEVWLGRKVVAMGGIGGVATWADRQGKGYAAELMLDSLRLMRQRQQPVSVLYPFSFRYYRKFGWEIAGHRIVYTNFQQNNLIPFEERSLVDAAKDTENINLLDRVYEEMAQRYNLCLRRSELIWQRKLEWLKKNNTQLYLIREGKNLIGWFTCQNKPLERGFESLTNEFAFVRESALRAMMGFFAALPTNVSKITVIAPYNLDLWVYFSEPFIQTYLKPEMQFRVVDLPAAIKARGYKPDVSGKIRISVNDKNADWNSGTWQIELERGEIVSVKKRAAPPDAECDIQGFSQLFCGYIRAEDLNFQGRLKVSNRKTLTLLNEIFYDLPTHTQDWF